MKKITMKQRRAVARYIRTFQVKGNKKLTDYRDSETGTAYKYAQFNLPARTTCPFHTKGCYRFCYAKRDERFPNVTNNRAENLKATRSADFVGNMIYTIDTELKSNRYKNAIMIDRIHESGDFYNQQYTNATIDYMHAFLGCNVIFQFYTKSFRYFINLSAERKEMLNNLLNAGNVGMSLSCDDTMTTEQRAELLNVKRLFPKANIYYAVADVNSINHDDVCDCADCGKCKKCVNTNGQTIAVAIH